MAYNVETVMKDDYLEAKVSGQRDSMREALDALKAINQIAKTCKEQQASKLLIIWDVAGRVNKDQIMLLMTNLEAYSWGKKHRIATVHLEEDNYRSNSFSKAIANQLGWQLNIFNDVNEAKNWLLQKNGDLANC